MATTPRPRAKKVATTATTVNFMVVSFLILENSSWESQ